MAFTNKFVFTDFMSLAVSDMNFPDLLITPSLKTYWGKCPSSLTDLTTHNCIYMYKNNTAVIRFNERSQSFFF